MSVSKSVKLLHLTSKFTSNIIATHVVSGPPDQAFDYIRHNMNIEKLATADRTKSLYLGQTSNPNARFSQHRSKFGLDQMLLLYATPCLCHVGEMESRLLKHYLKKCPHLFLNRSTSSRGLVYGHSQYFVYLMKCNQ